MQLKGTRARLHLHTEGRRQAAASPTEEALRAHRAEERSEAGHHRATTEDPPYQEVLRHMTEAPHRQAATTEALHRQAATTEAPRHQAAGRHTAQAAVEATAGAAHRQEVAADTAEAARPAVHTAEEEDRF